MPVSRHENPPLQKINAAAYSAWPRPTIPTGAPNGTTQEALDGVGAAIWPNAPA